MAGTEDMRRWCGQAYNNSITIPAGKSMKIVFKDKDRERCRAGMVMMRVDSADGIDGKLHFKISAIEGGATGALAATAANIFLRPTEPALTVQAYIAEIDFLNAATGDLVLYVDCYSDRDIQTNTTMTVY